MEIEILYNKLKSETQLPCVNIVYIVLEDNCYNFFAQPISFREKNESIATLTEISKKPNFFAFAQSQKGKEFIKENQEKIAKKLTETFFGEGLGRVCKN